MPRVVDVLSRHDDTLLEHYVDPDARICEQELSDTLWRLNAVGAVTPVIFGSAITGAGIGQVFDALTHLSPIEDGDPEGPLIVVANLALTVTSTTGSVTKSYSSTAS